MTAWAGCGRRLLEWNRGCTEGKTRILRQKKRESRPWGKTEKELKSAAVYVILPVSIKTDRMGIGIRI